jgi:hypothetical protein
MEISACSDDETDSAIELAVARRFSECYPPQRVNFIATDGTPRTVSTWIIANQAFYYDQSGDETPYVPGDWRTKAIQSVR